MSSFEDHTRVLKGQAEECDDLQRIANPYFQAADWEKTGNSLGEVVGTNGVADMYFAVNKLTKVGRDCRNCGIAGAVCRFAGVESMTQDEIIALVD